MNINDLEVIVLSCDKYLDTRCEAIRTTWATQLKTKFLCDSSSGHDLISYNTPKTYEGIQDKYYQFFLNYDFSQYSYYFFVDDDTFINITRLKNLDYTDNTPTCLGRKTIVNKDLTDRYGQNTGYPVHLLRNEGSHLPITYPSGGSGFILTQSACVKVQEYLRYVRDKRPISGHSDVSIGFWLRASGCDFIYSKLFWWDTLEKIKDNIFDKFEGDFLTLHYVTPELMVEYHNRFNI